MKTAFWTAVFTAILAVVGYFGKGWHEDREAARANIIEVRQSPAAVVIRPADLKNIQAAIGESISPINLSVIDLRSAGSKPIDDGKITIMVPNLLAFGLIDAPANSPNNVKVTRSDDVLEVTYNFFGKGRSHRLWIAKASNVAADVQESSSGLAVEAVEASDEKQERNAFDILTIGAALLASGVAFGIRLTERVWKIGQKRRDDGKSVSGSPSRADRTQEVDLSAPINAAAKPRASGEAAVDRAWRLGGGHKPDGEIDGGNF